MLVLCALTGCGVQPNEKAAEPVLSDIGMLRFNYIDESRSAWTGDGSGRPVAGWLWYPTADAGLAAPFEIPADRPVFRGGVVVRDGDIARGAHPLIVLSHGTGGSAFQMMWLGRRLADDGFITLAIDHHGNTAAEEKYDPRGFRYFWERPKDVSFVLDRVLADPLLRDALDPARIGAAGFSLGGYTVLASAGGRADLSQLEVFCASDQADATCAPQPEYEAAEAELAALIASGAEKAPGPDVASADFRDPRIKAVVALAPALGQVFTVESLETMQADTLVIVGAADATAPLKTNAAHIAEYTPNATLKVIPNAGHFIFLNECTDRGVRFVPLCKDAADVDRVLVHDNVAAMAATHFTTSFKGEP